MTEGDRYRVWRKYVAVTLTWPAAEIDHILVLLPKGTEVEITKIHSPVYTTTMSEVSLTIISGPWKDCEFHLFRFVLADDFEKVYFEKI